MLAFHWIGLFTHLSKVVEDLFEGSLGNLVLTDVILSFDIFHHAKQVANREIVTTGLDLPRVIVVLNDSAFRESTFQQINECVTFSFSVDPSEELLWLYLKTAIFEFDELNTNAISSELFSQIS